MPSSPTNLNTTLYMNQNWKEEFVMNISKEILHEWSNHMNYGKLVWWTGLAASICKKGKLLLKKCQKKTLEAFWTVEENSFFTLLPAPVTDHLWLIFISLTLGIQANEAIQTQKYFSHQQQEQPWKYYLDILMRDVSFWKLAHKLDKGTVESFPVRVSFPIFS